MADDIVYVMQDPPGAYTAAHQIEVGECVEFHTQAGGCIVQFSHKVHHTSPKHIPYKELPNKEVLYILAGGGEYSFYFGDKVTLQYWIGPPDKGDMVSLLAAAPGHTVVVGGVGFGKGKG